MAASALSSGGMLNTPVGQLIVASCVIDDVLGLVLLSMFQVLVKDDAEMYEYFIPLISSFGFLIVLGYSGITWIPRLIQENVFISTEHKHCWNRVVEVKEKIIKLNKISAYNWRVRKYSNPHTKKIMIDIYGKNSFSSILKDTYRVSKSKVYHSRGKYGGLIHILNKFILFSIFF